MELEGSRSSLHEGAIRMHKELKGVMRSNEEPRGVKDSHEQPARVMRKT